MGAPRWNIESLERALRRELLSRTSVRLKALAMDRTAEVEWTANGRIHVGVDHHEDGLRPNTIHELLHVVLEPEMAPFDEKLEEAIISGLEDCVNQRIRKSRRRVRWWRQAVDGQTKGAR